MFNFVLEIFLVILIRLVVNFVIVNFKIKGFRMFIKLDKIFKKIVKKRVVL